MYGVWFQGVQQGTGPSPAHTTFPRQKPPFPTFGHPSLTAEAHKQHQRRINTINTSSSWSPHRRTSQSSLHCSHPLLSPPPFSQDDVSTLARSWLAPAVPIRGCSLSNPPTTP